MSDEDYEDYEDDSNSEEEDVIDSFAFLPKVKSNTPRARFDIHFYSSFIRLIQYNVQKKVSNRYEISQEDVCEMFRLPYSNGKHSFFVLHLKRPIVGGNKSTTKYDFVVLNFVEDAYETINLDLTDPTVKDMFHKDIIESECISGSTIEVLETILVQIFDKEVVTPAKDYDGHRSAGALPCTFWDNDEHFLFPLDDGFVNVWKYCQKLKLKEVKNVRFIRTQGRFKTFDFLIYPKMERAIRRYNFGASKSRFIDCFFLEFKAIELKHYDGLFAYCIKNNILITTNDFRDSASDTDSENGRDSMSEGPTETNTSESDEVELSHVYDFEAPDPYMVQCQTEGRESETSSEENETNTSSEGEDADVTSSTSQQESEEVVSNSKTRLKRKRRSRNAISDEDDSSSNCFGAERKRRSLRIDSKEETGQAVMKKLSQICDSESD